MKNIRIHQKNEYQNYIEIPFNPVRMVSLKETTANAGKVTLLVGMQFSAATMKINMEVLKTVRLELPYDPAIPLLVYIQKNIGLYTREIPAYLCLLWYYSQ
jgi:hypothetical protein